VSARRTALGRCTKVGCADLPPTTRARTSARRLSAMILAAVRRSGRARLACSDGGQRSAWKASTTGPGCVLVPAPRTRQVGVEWRELPSQCESGSTSPGGSRTLTAYRLRVLLRVR
jgi:hypothetical protein